jgi:hypothetical protein
VRLVARGLLILVCLPAFADYSFADYYWQGIKVTCLENKVLIESFLLENQEPEGLTVVLDKGSTIYYGEQHSFECKLKAHKIEGTIQNLKGSERGMCGAMPGSEVTLSVNGSTVFRQQSFTNDCFESLRLVSFEESQWVGFVFRYCGDTGIVSTLRTNACFEFKQGQYERLIPPLSDPISSVVNFKLRK